MKCITEAGLVFDMGSLYAHLQTLSDKRNPKGLRYQLATILVLMVMAKLCGEDNPSGIAEWAQYRTELLAGLLHLERKTMPPSQHLPSYFGRRDRGGRTRADQQPIPEREEVLWQAGLGSHRWESAAWNAG